MAGARSGQARVVAAGWRWPTDPTASDGWAAGGRGAPGAPVAPRCRHGAATVVVAEAAALLVAALAVAGTFRTLYAGGRAWGPLVGAIVAAAAVTIGMRRLTDRWDALAVTSLVGAAGYLIVVVFGWADGRAVGGGRAFVIGLRSGWANLLSVGLPANPDPELLVVPVLALWLATASALALAMRPGTVLAPLAPLGLAFALAVTLLAGGHHPPPVLLALLVAAALGYGILRAARHATAPQRPAPEPPALAGRSAGAGQHAGAAHLPGAGALLLGVPVLVVATLIGTLFAVVVPAGGRFDPRTVHAQPLVDVPQPDPLAQVRAQLTAAPPRAVASVRLASSSSRLPVDRVTTAVLADFDGASWRNHDAFWPVGAALPGDRDEAGTGLGPQVAVHADVTVQQSDSPLLPVIGRPTRLATAPATAAYDPRTGTLLRTSGAAAGPLRYQLTATVPTPSPAQLAAAVPGSGPALARYLAVPPGLPALPVTEVTRATAAARTTYDQLTALADYLRDPQRFPYDLAGRPGHSYGAVTRLLTSTDPRERRSYAEAHAAAFALLARLRGIPSRIAVGYLLGPRAGSGAGTFTLTQAQAHTWPEVFLAGLGWIPFEPTDTSRLSHEEPPDASGAAAGGGSAAGAGSAEPIPATPPTQTAIPRLTLDERHAAANLGLRLLIVVLAVLVMLVVLAPLVIVVAKAERRRRRRGAHPPGRRVAGAWQEARDRLAERGVATEPTRTPGEIAAAAARLGPGVTEPVQALATLVSQALYGRTGGTDADAVRAWDLLALLRTRLGAQGRRRQRLAGALDPRPLLPTRAASRRRALTAPAGRPATALPGAGSGGGDD